MITISSILGYLIDLDVVPDIISNDTRLIEDLGMDEFDPISLALTIEADLDISIEDELIAAWKTVGDVIQTVNKIKG